MTFSAILQAIARCVGISPPAKKREVWHVDREGVVYRLSGRDGLRAPICIRDIVDATIAVRRHRAWYRSGVHEAVELAMQGALSQTDAVKAASEAMKRFERDVLFLRPKRAE